MSRTKKNKKTPGFEYWTARPGNKYGGLYSPNGNKFFRRQTHKAERQENKQAVLAQLVEQLPCKQ